MIDFKTFKQILDEAKRYQTISDNVYNSTSNGVDLFNIYGAENGEYTPECFLVCILEKICNDDAGTIGYWAFECNFGEDVAIIDDTKISSVEELYKYVKGENLNCK